MEINNSIVVVTGGTSGIGLAIAEQLHDKGAIVYAIARKDRKGIPFEVFQSDLSSLTEAQSVIEKILSITARVDILINSAAQGMFGSVEETSLSGYSSIVNLNLFAPIALMQGVIPSMKERKSGMIINVGAMATNEAIVSMGPYLATKAALESITRVARRELRNDGIKVSCLMPKHTETGFANRAIGQAPSWAGKMKGDSAELVAKAVLEELIEKELPELKM